MQKIFLRSWVASLIFIPALTFAAVTVTPATGGSAISADTAGGSYVALTGPVITESNNGEIGANNTNQTIILNAPSGFVFDTTGSAPTVKITCVNHCGSSSTNINNVTSGTSVAITSRTASQVTFTVTDYSEGNTENSLTWEGLRVRPSSGTPLASGNITKSGTASVSGVTGSTNFGSLAEVAGAVSAANSTVSASPLGVSAVGGSVSTVTVTAKDQFGNAKSGATVVLSSTGTNNTLTQPVSVTSASGVATGSLASTKAEAKTVSATVAGTGITQTAGVTFTAGAASTAAIAINPVAPIEAASGSTILTVTVKDANGNTVVDGTAVTVSTTLGTVTGSGATVAGVVTRTLSANSVGAATLSVAGLSVTGTTSVAFQDTMAPVIAAHSAVSAEAISVSGAVVTYAAPAATDAVDGVSVASCAPASGTTFALGMTSVTCTKTDAHGNSAAPISFNVVVTDTTAPSVASASNVTMEAVTASGATVTYTTPTATDLVDGSVAVTCTPASGSTFALGTTTVTCAATDAHGNTGSSSFNVVIQDMTAPTLVLPTDITVEATSSAGTAVAFMVSATDLVDGSVAVACTPASGSTFVLGTTTVTCSATDTNANTSTGTFNVTVSDTTSPSIATNADMILATANPVGMFSVPNATDTVDAAPVVTCTPASGSTFALGTTTVTCTAIDASLNSATSTFSILVEETPAPVASPAAGSYSAILSVSLSAASSTSMRYTDDGTVPDCSTGTLYSSPITLISSKTIKSVACYPGGYASAVDTSAYVINLEGTTADFSSFIANGVFVPASGRAMSSTPTVTVTQNVTVHITTGLGTADVVIPAGTVITAADGSDFDGNLLSGEDAILAPLGNLASAIYINGALQWGIPSFGLTFSPAITISIPVRDAANGTVLTIYRSVTGKSGWTDEGLVAGTCTVSGGACSFSATKASYYVVTSMPSGAVGSGAGGSSGSGSTSAPAASAPSAPAGQVLGASVSCGKYLSSYLKMGGKNDVTEVKKLQQFLNEQGFKVAVTGTYDRATRTAVMAFQKAHKNEILVPWAKYGVSQEGTGTVYKTTQWFINNLQCPALGLPMPSIE